MKLAMQPHRLLVVCALLLGCGHASQNQSTATPSRTKNDPPLSDVPTIRLNPECGFSPILKRTTSEERNLALDYSIKLLHRLRGRTIPTQSVREAVASGLPLVETVLGDQLKPIVGPDLRSKPFPAFARLTVGANNIKLRCVQIDSGGPIEFVPIVVEWNVEGAADRVSKWFTEDREIYNYGVRLDQRRGDLFFYRLDGMATELHQAESVKTPAP